MSIETLSDESVIRYYEGIRKQAEADSAHKYPFTAAPSVRQRAQMLRDELVRRRLQHFPISWPGER